MKIEKIELKGYVCEDDNNIKLVKELAEDRYHWYVEDSIAEIISEHFRKLVKPLDIEFEDWTRGNYVTYKDVFVQYYISDSEITWEQADERMIRKMAGDIELEDKADGYSEYTVTDSWTDMFVGGRDIRDELKNYEGKYCLLRVNYKLI